MFIRSSILVQGLCCRELERQEKEEKEKEQEAKRRAERKNRDALKELMSKHLKEGVLHAKIKWKVRVVWRLWDCTYLCRTIRVFLYSTSGWSLSSSCA
jgi:hypothetical protein